MDLPLHPCCGPLHLQQAGPHSLTIYRDQSQSPAAEPNVELSMQLSECLMLHVHLLFTCCRTHRIWRLVSMLLDDLGTSLIHMQSCQETCCDDESPIKQAADSKGIIDSKMPLTHTRVYPNLNRAPCHRAPMAITMLDLDLGLARSSGSTLIDLNLSAADTWAVTVPKAIPALPPRYLSRSVPWDQAVLWLRQAAGLNHREPRPGWPCTAAVQMPHSVGSG